MSIKNLFKISFILFISLFLFGCTANIEENTNTNNVEGETETQTTSSNTKIKKYISGILKSIDGGKTWEEKTYVDRDEKNNIITIGDSFVYSIKNSPLDSRILVAATKNNGLYISYNQGEQWQSLFSEIGKDVQSYSFSMSSPRTFYVAHQNKVYKTVNGGIDWNAVYIDNDSNIKAVFNDPDYNNTIYIFTADGRVIEQTDGKALILQNFSRLNNGYGYGAGIKSVFFYDSTAKSNYVLFNDNTIFTTNDYGVTYSILKTIPSGVINNMYLYQDSSESFLITTTSGIFRTNNNGKDWDEINLLSVNKSVDTLAISPKNKNIIYYSKNNLLYTTFNDGYNWQVIEMPIGRIVSSININPQNNQVLFIGLDIVTASKKSADVNIACDLLGILFPIFCK